jgi:hypothetical protein
MPIIPLEELVRPRAAVPGPRCEAGVRATRERRQVLPHRGSNTLSGLRSTHGGAQLTWLALRRAMSVTPPREGAVMVPRWVKPITLTPGCCEPRQVVPTQRGKKPPAINNARRVTRLGLRRGNLTHGLQGSVAATWPPRDGPCPCISEVLFDSSTTGTSIRYPKDACPHRAVGKWK